MKRLRPLKRDAQKEFLAVLERELKLCRLPDQKEVDLVMRTLARGGAPPKGAFKNPAATGFLSVIAQGIRAAAKMRKFKNEAELDKAIEQTRGLNLKMRESLGQVLELYKDLLPRKKRGPKPSLSEAKKAEARRLIQSYIRNGMTTKFAVAQAAQSFKATPRTMRRVWESGPES